MRVQRLYGLFLLFFLLDLALLVVAALPARAAGLDDREVYSVVEPLSGADTVTASRLRLHHASFGYVPAIQLAARAHFRITGLVAHVQLEQTFRNDTDQWVEGEYLFPLPDDAAVNRLKLVIGERVIIGKVREKKEARVLYDEARASGRRASLVEQRRANLFSNRVANIAPGETVVVALDYVQRINYRGGQFSLRFPMTVTPRYTPAGHPAAEVWQFLNPEPASLARPIQPITLTAEINMGLPLSTVDAPYHKLTLTRDEGIYHVALANGAVPMDRDFVLRWQPQPGSVPRAAAFHERIGASEYALLMVLPPTGPAQESSIPREIVFVIDTSGSMGGESITQARASLDFGLGQLSPANRFNIIEFNTSARRLFREPVAATQHNLVKAREFIRHLDARGGTEMRAALELALPLPVPNTDERLRQVVFITDGAVGNEVDLFREIHRRLGGSRLFTVGIGSAPNSWFMRKAAEAGRGDFITIGDVVEVQESMQALFTRLGQTALANIRIDWPVAAETYPTRVPDLYPGEPLLIAARASDSFQGSSVVVRGQGGDRAWEESLLFAPPPSGLEQAYTGIGTIWARAKIASLLDQEVLGRDKAEVRAAVLPVALEHQLVSPFTSFLAVEQKPHRPSDAALRAKPVPNLRPRGQSPQSYAYPRTATAAREQLVVGLLLLICACVFWRSPASAWR